jgi:hypothetical protein
MVVIMHPAKDTRLLYNIMALPTAWERGLAFLLRAVCSVHSDMSAWVRLSVRCDGV